jgi:hypothetical protein
VSIVSISAEDLALRADIESHRRGKLSRSCCVMYRIISTLLDIANISQKACAKVVIGPEVPLAVVEVAVTWQVAGVKSWKLDGTL